MLGLRWLRDYSSKEHEVIGIVCDPQDASPGYYNTWQGFVAENIPPIPDEQVPILIAAILYHVTAVICAGNQEHADWFLDWLAQIVQFPWIISQVAIMLYGDQGVGKDIFLDWFRLNLLGPHCTYQTCDPENRIFSRFSVGRVDRVLIQMDEVKDLKSFYDNLKDVVTGTSLVLLVLPCST